METLRVAWSVLKKDLRIEARTGDITLTTGLFAVLVVVLASLSFYIDRNNALLVAPGVLWVTIAFSGVLAMGRSWARERDNDVMRAMLMAPIPRAGIYLGKAAGAFLFLAVVEAVLVPLVGVLFHLDLFPVLGSLAALLAGGTIGFVAAGTLFAVMTVRTSARDLILSVVVFPLVAPMLLAGVVATRQLLQDAPFEEVLEWVRIMAAFDLIFVFAGMVLFDPLTSE
jgi:heme exporter protein B